MIVDCGRIPAGRSVDIFGDDCEGAVDAGGSSDGPTNTRWGDICWGVVDRAVCQIDSQILALAIEIDRTCGLGVGFRGDNKADGHRQETRRTSRRTPNCAHHFANPFGYIDVDRLLNPRSLLLRQWRPFTRALRLWILPPKLYGIDPG